MDDPKDEKQKFLTLVPQALKGEVLQKPLRRRVRFERTQTTLDERTGSTHISSLTIVGFGEPMTETEAAGLLVGFAAAIAEAERKPARRASYRDVNPAEELARLAALLEGPAGEGPAGGRPSRGGPVPSKPLKPTRAPR